MPSAHVLGLNVLITVVLTGGLWSRHTKTWLVVIRDVHAWYERLLEAELAPRLFEYSAKYLPEYALTHEEAAHTRGMRCAFHGATSAVGRHLVRVLFRNTCFRHFFKLPIS